MKFIRESGPGIIEVEIDGKIDYLYEEEYKRRLEFHNLRKSAKVQEQMQSHLNVSSKLLMSLVD